MAARKPRSRKPKAAPAPVEVVADSPDLDEKKMEEDGFEKTRARTARGHFVKDDPSTPENEAYEWTKPVEVEGTPIVDLAPVPTPENEYQELEKVTEPEPVVEETPISEPLIVIPLTGILEIEAPEPVVEEVIPEPVVEVVKVVPPSKPVQVPASPITYANPNGEYIANSFKRRRALRRGKR